MKSVKQILDKLYDFDYWKFIPMVDKRRPINARLRERYKTKQVKAKP